jgi:hypothetical protein
MTKFRVRMLVMGSVWVRASAVALGKAHCKPRPFQFQAKSCLKMEIFWFAVSFT